MKAIKNIVFVFCLMAALNTVGQVSKAESGTFLLKNATVITVTNGTQENTSVLLSNGKIVSIGKNIDAPQGAQEIDCTGKFIYPGLIDSGTSLGLVEVGSLSETRDNSEIGKVNSHIKALTAINPNSVAIPVTRVEGVTTVLVNPSGDVVPGQSALVNLHGYTPEQMHTGFTGMRINFPNSGRRGRRDSRSEEDIKKDMDKALKSLNEIWDKAEKYNEIAQAYEQNNSNPKPGYYPELEAMRKVVTGNMKVLIEVNAAKDILAAIDWVNEREVYAIFTGVAEGWRVADKLKEAEIPVITGPVITMPSRNSDRYDRAYANAGLLSKAGVMVAIRTNDTENVRNLPYNAGFAVAYGMDKEEALRAVTINPAKMFGLESQLGSIEEGKIANIIVTNGDPFETQTSIENVFIEGWLIPNDSRHIRLYQEFLERSPGVTK